MGKTDRSRRSQGRINTNRISKTTSQTLQRPRRQPPQISRAEAGKIGFGDLPAELRNLIYESALQPSSGKSVRIVQQPPGLSGSDLALGLLGSCKTVRREAWPFLYECNDFRIDSFNQRRLSPGDVPGIPQYSYASPGVVYNALPKSYGADLKRFIDCTNHKRAFPSIRSISFAYYSDDPRMLDAESDEMLPLPEIADIVLVVKLLPKRPFYSLTVDYPLSKESCERQIEKLVYHMDCMVRGIFEPESGGKKFCRTVVEDIGNQLHWACCIYKIGERK